MLFNLFRKKVKKDPYLEKVASILHSTIGPMMPIHNAYDLAAECLGELKSNISKGMFRDGNNPRESVMAYYSLCSMVSESSLNDDKATVLRFSIMAEILAEQFKDQSNLSPLEKGICIFGKQVLSAGLPKHTAENIAEIKLGAAEIIFNLVDKQGASVSLDDLLKLIDNVSANIPDKDIYKAGDKLLAISALSNVTGYSIDQDDIKMANVYANCVTAAFEKYVKGKKESFTDYQNGALQTIMKEHIPVLKKLMQLNTQDSEATQTDNKNSRLEDIVSKQSNSGFVFYDMDKDLAGSSNNWQNSAPELLMAYGYARRAISGALLIQGIGDKDNYQHTVSLFKSIQIQTVHTIEFQEEASHAAEAFMATYDPRINGVVLGLLVGLANAYSPFSALVRMEDHLLFSSLLSDENF